MRPYPTRNGLAVPTCEVELPTTRLNERNPNHFNNHHLEFSRRMFSHTMLMQTLRDLEFMQEMLPMDIHNMGKHNLHTIYGPPAMPTPRQAMDRIDDAYETGERLHIWNPSIKLYKFQPITHAMFRALKKDYYQQR